MKFNVVIEPRALADIQDAIDYYDEQQVGLGDRFKLEVDNHIKYLFKHPFFQTIYSDYRGLPLKKFPYVVFFYVNEELKTVYFSAVFNSWRDPEKYPK